MNDQDEIIRYKAGYKYQLVSDAIFSTPIHQSYPVESDFIDLDPDGSLTVKAGYAWDGPSGPTFDTKTFMRGSLAHDALYQLMRERKLVIPGARKMADKVLRDVCRSDGMSWIRSKWVYAAVRIGAKNSSQVGRKIQTAP